MASIPLLDNMSEQTNDDMGTLHKASWMVTVTLGHKIIELAVTSLFRNRNLKKIISPSDIENCTQLIDYLALLKNHGLLSDSTLTDICLLADARELLQTNKEQKLVTEQVVTDYSQIVERVINDIENCCAEVENKKPKKLSTEKFA